MTISSEINLALIIVVVTLTFTVMICVRWIMHLRSAMKLQGSALQSLHVKTGNIAEQMAPLSSVFPWNPEGFKFLGNPIDGIQFEKEKIIFIEFKTANSTLNSDQRNIRELVKSGKVEFELIKLK